MLFHTFLILGVTTAFLYSTSDDEHLKVDYLGDVLNERIPLIKQSWGKLGINTATHAPDKAPLPLCIMDKAYDKGLGTHANSEIIVELDGEYESFEAEIGVQKQNGDNVGSVIFQIFVDGEELFNSGIVRELDPAKGIKVSLLNAEEMRLIVTDAGDGITCDCANWANARLIRSVPAKDKIHIEPPDIAQFARIMTCDPYRNDGCRCNRVEEFPENDVFLEEEVLSDTEGLYIVPANEDGIGCIGLKWFEMRPIKRLTLLFSDDSHIPSIDDIELQGWFGESAWQGNWKKLNVSREVQDKQFIFALDYRAEKDMYGSGIEKVRWIFPKCPKPIKIRKISAFTNSRWIISDFYLEMENPVKDKYGNIEIYNGLFMESDKSNINCSWDLSSPIYLRILHNRSRYSKPDRTVIIIRLPEISFGIAIDDVIAYKCVYVPNYVFMTTSPSDYKISDYKEMIANKETILQKVRKIPDQTFEKAMERVHRDIQNNGPTILSLACDNNKFIVQREGKISFGNFEMQILMGSGEKQNIKRHLYGGWLPAPVTTIHENGIQYEQRTFVVPYDKNDTEVWLNNKPLCVAEFTIKNESFNEIDSLLKLMFITNIKENTKASVSQQFDGFIVRSGDKILAYVNLMNNSNLKVEIQDGSLILYGKLPCQYHQRCNVYIPAWEISTEECRSLSEENNLISVLKDYWDKIFNSIMKIDIPDKYLLDVIRASQVHCLIAARNDSNGRLIQPWIASMAYGPLESEAHSIIRGMGLMGHIDFAQRSLDFFISSYNPKGFLTTGYTLMGTGWHLWTLGEFYQLTKDKEWLKQNAQAIMKVCSWIAQQLDKTKKLNAKGEKYPEYGLMPPGVVADWNRFAYRTFMEGHYFAGLYEATKALSEIGYPDADLLHEKSLEFRDNILRAYKWTQERSPVVSLSNGRWVLPYPGIIYCFGFIGDMFPGEDWNRTWAGDVEIGSHHLIPLGIINADSQETEWILDHMEDFWFLKSGMGEYIEQENKDDWFNLGGFAKVQPYYARITEIYAMRDDIKPFIRSYFNTIPSLLNTENLSFWEHFHNMGAWNKTHETGAFLLQTRFMFVMEKGDDLWIAPFVTNNWLEDGMCISVENAPTRFGMLSYQITSSVDKNYIDVIIAPPKNNPPKEIIIRLRHPKNKNIRNVILNGMAYKDFDSVKECIRIKPSESSIKIRVEY